MYFYVVVVVLIIMSVLLFLNYDMYLDEQEKTEKLSLDINTNMSNIKVLQLDKASVITQLDAKKNECTRLEQEKIKLIGEYADSYSLLNYDANVLRFDNNKLKSDLLSSQIDYNELNTNFSNVITDLNIAKKLKLHYESCYYSQKCLGDEVACKAKYGDTIDANAEAYKRAQLCLAISTSDFNSFSIFN